MVVGDTDRMLETALRVYAEFDADLQTRLPRYPPVSCRPHCASCCHLIVTCNFSEVIVLVLAAKAYGYEFNNEEIKAQFEAIQRPGVTLASWFGERRPCAFLSGTQCAFYEYRPAACRFHYVFTPVENCALGAVDPTTKSPNFVPLQIRAVDYLESRLDQLPAWARDIHGPLPFLLPFAMVFVQMGPDMARGILRNFGIESGITSVDRWLGLEGEIRKEVPISNPSLPIVGGT